MTIQYAAVKTAKPYSRTCFASDRLSYPPVLFYGPEHKLYELSYHASVCMTILCGHLKDADLHPVMQENNILTWSSLPELDNTNTVFCIDTKNRLQNTDPAFVSAVMQKTMEYQYQPLADWAFSNRKSRTSVIRQCRQHRIKNAVCTDTTWLIPKQAAMPPEQDNTVMDVPVRAVSAAAMDFLRYMKPQLPFRFYEQENTAVIEMLPEYTDMRQAFQSVLPQSLLCLLDEADRMQKQKIRFLNEWSFPFARTLWLQNTMHFYDKDDTSIENEAYPSSEFETMKKKWLRISNAFS